LPSYKSFIQRLPQITQDNFEEFALQLFRYQVKNNSVYHKYTGYLGLNPDKITSLEQIPFMPVEFFKRHAIKTERWEEENIFSSSGTSGNQTSQHPVREMSVYLDNTERIFTHFYGHPEDYHIFGLLPSYLERTGSSLIAMVSHFITLSKSDMGGFYLYDYDQLLENITKAREKDDRKILLIGVSFALLELAEKLSPNLQGTIVMETGGMKGRRSELTRHELHEILQEQFNVPEIHSEYGMTEMYSQGYSKQLGIFQSAPTMNILLRDPNDPLDVSLSRERGGINIIDLANIHSCAFIATDDLGVRESGRTFRVLGRLDNSDIRGCNLMVG
jgi:phenylacetate-coenzyme A ligase PaaK-like adenylate-forming protein